jgi:hypothetical protein
MWSRRMMKSTALMFACCRNTINSIKNIRRKGKPMSPF